MEDFDKLLDRSKDYMEGIQKGREIAIMKYDKLLLELWNKMEIIESKIDSMIESKSKRSEK